jgi:hypothetical protein
MMNLREMTIEEMLANDMPFVFTAADYEGMFTALQSDTCDGNYMLSCGKASEKEIKN